MPSLVGSFRILLLNNRVLFFYFNNFAFAKGGGDEANDKN
jgi:hypothetical protein